MTSEENILKHFDDIFETDTINHIKLNMKLLKSIFYHLSELPTLPSVEYKKVLHKQILLADKLISTMTEEQQKLFKKYQTLSNETAALTDEQLFCFGYIFAKELEQEGNISKE